SSNFRVTVRDTQYFPTRRSSDLARAKLALPEALHGRHNSLGQEHHDQHHGDAVHDPLDLGAGHFAQANRKNAKDDSTDDGSDQSALAARDHHDHHCDGVDEQEDVRVDDAN